MGVDVQAETTIARPRLKVAAYATNPKNDPVWIGGISEARSLTESPIREGSRVARIATFLGKRIEYVNEVVEYEPDARLVMHSIQSPFPMTVTYEFEDAGDGTLARIRVQGDAGGFYRLAAPVLARTVRRSITNDLDTLKRLLESAGNQIQPSSPPRLRGRL